MNVFFIEPKSLTDINTQILRLGPKSAKVCIVEYETGDPDDKRVEFATRTAQLIAADRGTTATGITVKGYQIGSSLEERTQLFKLFFVE